MDTIKTSGSGKTVYSKAGSKKGNPFDRLASAPFYENCPTKETAQMLKDELLFQRATQTYLLALPLIYILGMKNGSEKTFSSGYNVMPIWKKRLDARTLITIPNFDFICAMSYIDLGREGPIVFEAPPKIQGILLDFWQRPIPADGGEFFGTIGYSGPDRAKGGKFLLLPPGYIGEVPDDYFVYRSATSNVFIFLQGGYQDPKDISKASALIEQVKIYPLDGKFGAIPMIFPDASGVPVNMLPASNGAVFDQLKRFVDSEVSDLAGFDALGMLAAIGIIKGRPFKPNRHTREILDKAAKTAWKMSRVISFLEVLNGESLHLYADRQWISPDDNLILSDQANMLDSARKNVAMEYLDIEARPWFCSGTNLVSKGRVLKIPGEGIMIMISCTDSKGENLSGGNSYCLKLPAKIPAEKFWSVTLYDTGNASGLASGQAFPSLSSRNDIIQDVNGDTKLYLGPKAPVGKSANWLATVPGCGYFVILRLYCPTEKAINRIWKPGDIVKVSMKK
jgi:hypothetical protein